MIEIKQVEKYRFPRTKKPAHVERGPYKVINIRGTNGSGKSVIIMRLIKRYCIKRLRQVNGDVWAYVLRIPDVTGKVYILGRYETPTGGCDMIKTQDDVSRGVYILAHRGHVLFEGLLVSGISGRWITLCRATPSHKFIFGILDTPVKKCIKRAEKRRAARGDTRPLDPKNLLLKYRGVESSRKLLKSNGMDVRDINHKKALITILKWLKEGT